MSNEIKKIAVVGRDIDAWFTSFTLQLAFSRLDAGIEVTLYEQPSEATKQDLMATLPSQKALFDTLGLSESQILKASAGRCSLGQYFTGWSGGNSAFMGPYDTHGVRLAHIDFLQYWLKAKNLGLDIPLEEFSLGAVAAKQGCYVLHSEKTRAFSHATHGYHLSLLSFVAAIARSALGAGVVHQRRGGVADVSVDAGRIRSIIFADGSTAEADLFIDATGVRSELISKLDGDGFEGWGDWFLNDREITASAPLLEGIHSYSQVTAVDEGWFGVYPLANRMAVSGRFNSQVSSPDAALYSFAKSSGLNLTNPTLKKLTYGVRRRSWVANCIAVGAAAASLDELDAVTTSTLFLGLSYLIELFPVSNYSAEESEVYNKKIVSHAQRIRDFQLAHYKLNKREDSPLWDQLRSMEVPDSLRYKMQLFESCGKVAMYNDETFLEENWISLFIGHGLIPEQYSHFVDRLSGVELKQFFRRVLQDIAEEVSEMPSMKTYIEMQL